MVAFLKFKNCSNSLFINNNNWLHYYINNEKSNNFSFLCLRMVKEKKTDRHKKRLFKVINFPGRKVVIGLIVLHLSGLHQLKWRNRTFLFFNCRFLRFLIMLSVFFFSQPVVEYWNFAMIQIWSHTYQYNSCN